MKRQGSTARRFWAMCAVAILLIGGSLLEEPASVQAANSAARGTPYFQFDDNVPALYVFGPIEKSSGWGTGYQTPYLNGNVEFAVQHPYAWTIRNGNLVIQFASGGYTQVGMVTSIDENAQII